MKCSRKTIYRTHFWLIFIKSNSAQRKGLAKFIANRRNQPTLLVSWFICLLLAGYWLTPRQSNHPFPVAGRRRNHAELTSAGTLIVWSSSEKMMMMLLVLPGSSQWRWQSEDARGATEAHTCEMKIISAHFHSPHGRRRWRRRLRWGQGELKVTAFNNGK